MFDGSMQGTPVENSKLTKEVGNVTADSGVVFQYRIRNDEESLKLLDTLTELPFQVQVLYTKREFPFFAAA